jgi:hypothetical protein
MRTALQDRVSEQREIQRSIVQGDARLCRGNFGKAWKGLFPYKSAEELASRAGYKSVRTASYEISGERPPSAKAMAILMSLCAD